MLNVKFKLRFLYYGWVPAQVYTKGLTKAVLIDILSEKEYSVTSWRIKNMKVFLNIIDILWSVPYSIIKQLSRFLFPNTGVCLLFKNEIKKLVLDYAIDIFIITIRLTWSLTELINLLK